MFRAREPPGGAGTVEEDRDEARGKVDGVAVLYVVGGIPALVGFLVVLFMLARGFDIPA
jgi:hypothetical protein